MTDLCPVTVSYYIDIHIYSTLSTGNKLLLLWAFGEPFFGGWRGGKVLGGVLYCTHAHTVMEEPAQGCAQTFWGAGSEENKKGTFIAIHLGKKAELRSVSLKR